MKVARFHKMQENLDSSFQRDLSKFQDKLKKRKEKLKKYDEFIGYKREDQGFKFLKYYKMREMSKLNLRQQDDQ